MFQFTDLREQLAQYLSEEQVQLIAEAYGVAADAHEGQKRYSGEPYITHPLEVARILGNIRMDHQSLMAAILHDVIEDTDVKKESIVEKFGEKVGELVDGVSKLTQIKFESREQEQAENFRKMMLAMANDIRVILIKLADRLHNMRTLGGLPSAKRRRKALETLEIYAPIANRLGMNAFKTEYEDLGFSALYPLRYRVLKEAVKKARGHRKEIIATIKKEILNYLEKAQIKQLSVTGREKHLYSLYKKMHRKNLSFSEVMDVYAFRIIVATKDECYRVLGGMHGLYRPVSNRFKDYIAIPKANGYQSIHTTLLGPFGVPIEIQVRTQQMDQVAENGIASHWLYKSGEKNEKSPAQLRAREWLKGLLEIQENTEGSLEFIENVKIDLYPDEVYVFTPKGDIFSLPQGATPVDFAYQVHTDVGDSCVACKIDRRLSPLSTRLESGQTIEVVTAKGAHPNPAWLSFSVTGKARSNIRHWLKNQQRTESQALGRRLINNVLMNSNMSVEQVDNHVMDQFVQEMGVESQEVLFEEVGLGKRMAALVAQHLGELAKTVKGHENVQGNSSSTSLIIKGTEGLVVTYATCCYPIPGDLILGHISEGQGIVIHTEHCPKIKAFRDVPEKCIHLTWEEDIEGEFQVPLLVDVINDRGVLASLASVISESNANINNVGVDHRDGHHNTIRFIITVRNRGHLARIMRRLRSIGMVTRIARGKPSA